VLADLRRDAAAGAAAREEQVKARRLTLVDAATEAGKIRAADRNRWLRNLELDPEGYEEILAQLEPGLAVNTTERGYNSGDVETTEQDEIKAVVESDKFKGWVV
jgi:Holliday junction resolvasome RuvABC ATP-dependent DNA helicase subunit